jgi:hypothetical protein
LIASAEGQTEAMTAKKTVTASENKNKHKIPQGPKFSFGFCV